MAETGSLAIDTAVLVAAVALALAMRPWRAVGPGGPPWPWLAAATVMPLLWGLDRHAGQAVALPLSGAPLLVLLAGWPLAVLLMLPVAAATLLITDVGIAEALHRLAWLGMVPASIALGFGAALRRWLPHHLFIYILGRGFFGTLAAAGGAAALALLLHATPAGIGAADLLLARVLASFGEAFITGLFTAILVAYRPQWLATYADRLYLPPAPRG